MPFADFTARLSNGQEQSLAAYRGKVVLIVNVASQCGFTPQYKGLQALHDRYAARGLEILGFPCNQFGGQEPGTDADIATFCETTYRIRFPLFARIDVNGNNAHPLYVWLKAQKPGLFGRAIKWNFTKFLLGRDGAVQARFAPNTKPEGLARHIEKLL